MNIHTKFENMISNLDLELFAKIKSQTLRSDKISLLAIQNAVRKHKESYIYLEIGSHLGGSIQPHLLDPKCQRIYSIDKRPEVQPDLRFNKEYNYPNNSTKMMLNNLKQISSDLNKIICFDDDASNIDKSEIIPKLDICLIDAEHTDKAVVSDFNFCLAVLNDSGVIVFHDSNILFKGINTIIRKLKKSNIVFRAYNLPGVLFVIEISNYCIYRDNKINSMIIKPIHKTRYHLFKFLILVVNAFDSRLPSKQNRLVSILYSILAKLFPNSPKTLTS